MALSCFNVGVELGQLGFVAAVLAFRPAWLALRHALGPRVATVGHYAIGTAATSWFIERIVAFWPQV
jgi:hypothetical protein